MPGTPTTRKGVRQKWVKEAERLLKGRTIVGVRYLDEEEIGSLAWHERAMVLQLDDGTIIYPGRDCAPNGPGTLVGNTRDGKAFLLPEG